MRPLGSAASLHDLHEMAVGATTFLKNFVDIAM